MKLTYARRLDDGSVEYAGGRSVTLADGTVVTRPTRDQYVAAGWKVVMDGPPPKQEPLEGKEWEKAGLVEHGNMFVPRWRPVDKVPAPVPAPVSVPRKWSRFSIKGALADAHMLPAAKAFLSAFEVKPDYTAWEALTDCDYIEEGYGGPEGWNAVLDGVAQALGKTRAEIDAFLDSIPPE